MYKFEKGDVLCFEREEGAVSSIVCDAISLAQRVGSLFRRKTYTPVNPNKIVHVGLVLDKKHYIESVGTGVVIKSIKELYNKPVWLCILKDSMKDKIYSNIGAFNKYINSQTSKPYDFKLFVRFLPYLLTGRLLFQPKEDKSLSVCSELVAAAFEAVGAIDENVSSLTPSDIFTKDWYTIRVKLNDTNKD